MQNIRKQQWKELMTRKGKYAAAAAMIAFGMFRAFSHAQPAEAADDSVAINLSDLDAQAGETVSITEDGYRIGDTEYAHNGDYIFTGTWDGSLSGRFSEVDYSLIEFRSVITIEKDVDADITFQDVVIRTTGNNNYGNSDDYGNPVRIAGDSTGDVTITLKGENYLECNNGSGAAALQKSSYTQLENAGTLTLRCEFSGQEGHVCTDACGSLTAVSRTGPGIGSQGSYMHEINGDMSSAALCSLHIEGGNIEAVCSAKGTAKAAIGTGAMYRYYSIMTETGERLYDSDFSLDASEMIRDLVISGGNVYAHANDTGEGEEIYVGIGMGLVEEGDTVPSSQAANITISGGTVRAEGSSGIDEIRGMVVSSGIGYCVTSNNVGADSPRALNIAITGGNVTAEASAYDTGYGEIFPGYGIDAHELTISGGAVNAEQGSGISADKFVIGTNSPVLRTSAVVGDTSYETDDSTQGIVFVDNTGTVYGDVILDGEELIADDETLTIPESASLTNNGILTVDGTLINENRFRNNGSFQYDNGTFTCVPHTLEETAEKEATHLTPGNILYYSCDYCGRIYEDAAGTRELSPEETIIEKLPDHTPDGTGWYSDENNHWNRCECGEKINIAPHSYVWVTDKEATSTEAGSRHEECDVCGFAKAAVEIPATGTPDGSSDESEKDEDGQQADTGKNDSEDAPQTGEHNNYLVWLALLAVSGAGLTGNVIYRRKKDI